MSGLNYDAYVRGPVDESGLRGLMSGEMQSRIHAYTVCINVCKSCSLKVDNYSKRMSECMQDFEDAYPVSDGAAKSSGVQYFNSVHDTASVIKSDFRDRQALYTSAKEFYERVMSNCESKISEANVKVQQLMQEKNEDGEPKYGNIIVKYSIAGEEVKYSISYSENSGLPYAIIV